MKILVIVASKNRTMRLKLLTLSWLRGAGIDYRILVEPQDKEAYTEIDNNLLVLPEDNQGLEYALLQGKKYAEENGYDVVFKIDDDIKGWTTMMKDNQTLMKNNTQRFLQIIQDIEKPLSQEGCGGVSFGYRQEFWHDKVFFGINQRFQTCYIVKTALFNPIPNSVSKGMWEDMINFLRVIDKGYKVIRYGRYQMDTAVESGMEGGLTDYYKNRGPEQYNLVIEEVKKEFPWMPFKAKDNGRIELDFDCPAIGGKKL